MNQNESSPIRIVLGCLVYGVPSLLCFFGGAWLVSDYPVLGRLATLMGLLIIFAPAVKKAAATYPTRLNEAARKPFKHLFYIHNALLFNIILVMSLKEAFPSPIIVWSLVAVLLIIEVLTLIRISHIERDNKTSEATSDI